MFDFEDAACPKCGKKIFESASSLESTDDILETGIMEWTCSCGHVFKEELSPEEIMDLEDEFVPVKKDKKAKGVSA